MSLCCGFYVGSWRWELFREEWNMLKEFYQELDERYAQGDQEKVERFLLSNASAFCPCCGKFNETYLACMSELGAFYRGASKYDASIDAFRSAEDMILEFIGKNTPEYATNTNNMAGAYRMKGDYKTALRLFLDAKQVYEDTIGTENYEYASVLNNLSLLYQNMQENEKAIDALKQALAVLEKVPESGEEIATGHSNLAVLMMKTGDNTKAREMLQRAFAKMPENSFHYPALLNTAATLEYREENYEAAAQKFLEALEKVQAFFHKNVEYAIACENLKKVYETMGEYEKALPYLTEAQSVYARIYGKDHETAMRAEMEIAELKQKMETGENERT